MEEIFGRYPIGIQNFAELSGRNCVYVDKTDLIYRLTHTNKYYFLSRPYRFGKSLFNVLAQKKYANFRFSTGTPTFLIELLQKSNFNIWKLDSIEAIAEQFDVPSDHISAFFCSLPEWMPHSYDPHSAHIWWHIPTRKCGRDFLNHLHVLSENRK